MSDNPLYVMFGEPTPGWCDKCHLPSRLRYPLTFMDDTGVSNYGGGMNMCEGCRKTDES